MPELDPLYGFYESQQTVIEVERGPFIILGREIIHDRFGKQLIADTVVRPDRTLSEYFWVNFKRPAVLIFPLDDEGNIYLTDEFTYATNRYSIEVPGGSIDLGEYPEQAARREAREELGLEINSLHHLTTLWAITSPVYNESHLYLARVASVGKAKPEPGEVICLKKVPFTKAVQMVYSGEISTDSVVAGILLIKNRLNTQGSLENN